MVPRSKRFIPPEYGDIVAGRSPLEGGTQIVSFHGPKALLNMLDELVAMGVFNNRSEAIRLALYKLMEEYRDFLLARRVGRRAHMVVGYR